MSESEPSAGLKQSEPAAEVERPRAPRSTVFTRWVVPLLLVWSGLLLSALVYLKKLDEPAKEPTPKLLLALLGVPAFSAVMLLALRFVAKRASHEHSRHGDLLLVWVMTFLFTIHASVLAATIGMFSLQRAVPITVALLMFGLGPMLNSLEPGSAMGIRTRATLSDPAIWRRTHRFAALLFVLAGTLGFVALLFPGRWVIFASLVPGLSAVVAAIIYAARQTPAPEKPLEEPAPAEDPPTEERL